MDDLHDFLTEDSSRSIDDFLRSLSAVDIMQQEFPATGQLVRQQTGQFKEQTFQEIQYKPGSNAAQLENDLNSLIGHLIEDGF
jgi:hypothetical protein